MKQIAIALTFLLAAGTASANLADRAYRTADMIERNLRNLTVAEKQEIRSHLRDIRSIIETGSTNPGRCDQATYQRAYDWGYKRWNGTKSQKFAKTIMQKRRCDVYLNNFTQAYEWGYKRWNSTKSEKVAYEIADATPRRRDAFKCFSEAYEWAYKRWNSTRSEKHAREMCLQ